jgi:hypothetical protein
MQAATTDLKVLTACAEAGDASAAARVRAELDPVLQRIVGRALRADARPTLLTRHLQNRARQLTGWQHGDEIQASAVNTAAGLARAAERRLLGGVSPRQPLRETIRDCA